MKKKILAVTALAFISVMFLGPLVALAQQEVLMTGSDGTNTVKVKVDTSGRIITATESTSPVLTRVASHAACTNTTQTASNSGAPCPTTTLTSRRFLGIQLLQAGETLNITTNGAAATSTTGIQIGNGDMYSDNLADSVSASCICSAASCTLRIVECP